MLVRTQLEFENIMNNPLTNLSTTIELPGGSVEWVLNITKPCTIFGNNTTIDPSSLGYDVAVTISASIDISDITVINSEKTAILLNSVKDSHFEKVRAGSSLNGWIIKDSMDNEFEECEAYSCGTGVELRGSSPFIGDIDSYQEFGFSNLTEEMSSGLLAGKDYYFKVSTKEYRLVCGDFVTIGNLVQYMNDATRLTDGQKLKADFLVTLTAGDIRITSLTNNPVNIARGVIGTDLLNSINGFDSKGTTIIQFTPDVNLSLQSKYWLFSNDIVDYYVWYSVNNLGINPNIANRTGIKIDIIENELVGDVANKTYQKLLEIRNDITVNNDTITIIKQSNVVVRQATQTVITFQDVLDHSKQSSFFEFSSLDKDYYAWYAIRQEGVGSFGVTTPVDPKTIMTSGVLKYPQLTNKIGIRVDLEVPNFASFSYTDGDIRTPTVDILKSLDYKAPDYLTRISNLKLSVTDKFYLELKKIQDPSLSFDIYGNKLTIITGADTSVHPTEDFNSGFNFSITVGQLDGVLDTTFGKILETARTDRCHNNIFTDCLIHENSVGIKFVNADNNEFSGTEVYQNTNIGIWQTDVSYNNIFRGEIYGNIKYGIRNTDREHAVDASSCWWGDITGPSGGGNGEGDKTSNYVNVTPWLQSGTEPELTYVGTRTWIWHMLGYPQVAVELNEEQVTECILVALEKHIYYWQPEPYYLYLNISEGQHEIELPANISKQSIIEVNYSPSSDIFAQLSGSGESFFLTYYMQQSGGTFLADFYIAMAYKETFERTLGLVPSYEFLTHPDANGVMKDYVRLYPRPSGNFIVGLKVSRVLSEKEVDQEMWIRKYALAWAKQMLGQIRAKFGSVPGPTGEVTLKGDGLIQEGKEEELALITDLIKRSEPLGFVTG